MNLCFWTVVLEETLESLLDYKEIQPVHPKGDQSWVFIGRTDVEAETPIFWPPHVKSWLIWKDPEVGKDWVQEEKGMTEDEMVGWHHWLNGHEFGWTLGVGDGQGGLACCGSWAHKESDTAERPNWTELIGLISLKSKGLPRVFPNTTIQKHEFFSAQLSLWSNSHIHIRLLEETIALTRWTFVGNNTLSSFSAEEQHFRRRNIIRDRVGH